MKQKLGSWIETITRLPAGIWVVVLVLPALIPLTWVGFFESHDGLFHVYRLAALDQAVRAGVLYPRWFPEFAFGYGHPVLNFYGPLSYYWGLPFTLLGASAAQGIELVLATGLVASALGMLLFARLYLDRLPSVVAAVVYAYLPYHLIDLYVRGAVAEFLAFAWFPLVLWAFHRLIVDGGRRTWTWVTTSALLLAALILTHNLSALIFAPLLAVYVTCLLLSRRDLRALGRVALAALLVAALSAFYWLPIIRESGYVGLGYGVSQGYRDHLLGLADLLTLNPTYDYAIEPPITFTLGWVQIIILGASFVLLIRARQRAFVLFWLVVALLSVFMLTTASLPVWQAFEAGLAFLQYPWRFLALTVLATGMLAGALAQVLLATAPNRRKLALAGLSLVVIGVWALWALPVHPILPDLSLQGMWHMDRRLGQIGATWTGEYLPVWVEEQRWAISYPVPEPSTQADPAPAAPTSPAEYDMRLTGVGYTRYDLTVDAPQGASLTLHQFHYPGWQAAWQGEVLPAQPKGMLGLASFELPPGHGSLTLRLALTPAQLWGTLISLVVALAAGVALLAHFRVLKQGAGPGLFTSERCLPLLLAACHLLLAAILLASLVLPNGFVRATNPVNASLEDIVELQAFSVDALRYRPGDRVEVTLYWTALGKLSQDYKTFIHLTDAAVTQQPTQHDDDPGGNFTPTTRWLPGELVPDDHYLTLPQNLAPGRYNIWADMYEYPAVRNLQVLSSEAETDGRRVLLTEIQVVAP